MAKIWAHSGDSHFLEPEDLFQQILPAPLAERMPWSERDGDDEIVHVDGKTLPPQAAEARHEEGQGGLDIMELSTRPPGARDIRAPACTTSTTKGSGARSSTPRSGSGTR